MANRRRRLRPNDINPDDQADAAPADLRIDDDAAPDADNDALPEPDGNDAPADEDGLSDESDQSADDEAIQQPRQQPADAAQAQQLNGDLLNRALITIAKLTDKVSNLEKLLTEKPPTASAPSQGKWRSAPAPKVVDLSGSTDIPSLINAWLERQGPADRIPLLSSVASMTTAAGPRNPVSLAIMATLPRPSRSPASSAQAQSYLARDGSSVLLPDMEHLDQIPGLHPDAKAALRSLRKDAQLESLERILSICLRLDTILTHSSVSQAQTDSSSLGSISASLIEAIAAITSAASSALVRANDDAINKAINVIASRTFHTRDRPVESLPAVHTVTAAISSALDVGPTGRPVHSSINMNDIERTLASARSSAVQYLALRPPSQLPKGPQRQRDSQTAPKSRSQH